MEGKHKKTNKQKPDERMFFVMTRPSRANDVSASFPDYRLLISLWKHKVEQQRRKTNRK